MASEQSLAELEASDEFVGRHVGPDADEQARLVQGESSLTDGESPAAPVG